jgi:hypothetical protein
MPNARQYEYGQLQKRDYNLEKFDPSFFFYYGNEQEQHKMHIHQVLNLLAQSHWEPCLYYEEREGETQLPTWIMRRLEKELG